jgi:hypothetical protein
MWVGKVNAMAGQIGPRAKSNHASARIVLKVRPQGRRRSRIANEDDLESRSSPSSSFAFSALAKRMTHLELTLINRPYGTRRVFFLFFQALRAWLPSF